MRVFEVVSAVAIAVVSTSCGGGVTHQVVASCPVVSGSFVTRATLQSVDGNCPLAKEVSKDRISFDKKGAFVSPAEGLVWCTTVQEDCEVHVVCKTNLVRAKGLFDGLLAWDGDHLVGTAVITGSYQGCYEVIYEVEAKRD